MQNKVENILNNLESHLYPDNGGEIPEMWGVGFQPTQNIAACIFNVHGILHSAIERAQKDYPHWVNDEEIPTPQIIIDYKEGQWILVFEILNSDSCGDFDLRFYQKIELSRKQVRILLTRLLTAGIRIYDCMGGDA
jgi:hypothetical protein